MITISIGIPAYNEEANIKKLILAILSQKTGNFRITEIIVISDGSTDETIKKVGEIGDKRIKLVVGSRRVGQSSRQNQIIELMSPRSECLLVFEADTLPADKFFIQRLVSSIPKDKKFSMIIGETIPIKPTNFFSKIVNFGIDYRYTIFEEATASINVYTCAENGLLSREFIKNFRWDNRYSQDTYIFRKAIESGLPIIRNRKANTLQKSVENLHDFLLQSGKFQKAKYREKKVSDLYVLHYDYIKVIRITLDRLLKNPILLVSYFMLMFFSRVYSVLLPQFSAKWEIYVSSKRLVNE